MQERIHEARAQAAASPREAYGFYRLGQIYFDADSLARATAALEQALARDRFHAPALSLLSLLHYKAGRHEQAVTMLEAARGQWDSFPDGMPAAILAGLALHYEALDRQDLARSVMASLPRPERGDVVSATTYLRLRSASPDSAVALAGAAVKEHPRSASSQNNYGITRLRAGDPMSARRAFQTAIELDPKLPGPYYNLAILEKYYLLDDRAASRWFKLYWERSHDDPDALAGVFGKAESKELAKKGEAP
jgi:tetratricopeptide (TPR) repeat protein